MPQSHRQLPDSRTVADFWNRHPVNADYLPQPEDWRSYFVAYDERRRATEPHITGELEKLDVAGKTVLEIGTGQGTESQWFAEHAGAWFGVDFTLESLQRVRHRFEAFAIPEPAIACMQGEHLAFADASFDIVFSHGVIHHSPRIADIVAEIERVLKPGGTAVIMVYHESSLNYHVSIRLLRRLGLLLLYVPGVVPVVSRVTGEPAERLRRHLDGFRREGPGYLRMERFLHASTDGPDNVYSSVFTRRRVRELFAGFDDIRCVVHHLNERHFPGLRRLLTARARARLARRWGWHLWIFVRKALAE